MSDLIPSTSTLLLTLIGTLWTAIATVFVAYIRGRPQMKRIEVEADGSLRTDLLARIDHLEKQLSAMEVQMEAERTRHTTEVQIIRHRLNNETASLDALLLLLEVAPDKLTDNITLIKEMRATRANAVALEQGAAAGAGQTRGAA